MVISVDGTCFLTTVMKINTMYYVVALVYNLSEIADMVNDVFAISMKVVVCKI